MRAGVVDQRTRPIKNIWDSIVTSTNWSKLQYNAGDVSSPALERITSESRPFIRATQPSTPVAGQPGFYITQMLLPTGRQYRLSMWIRISKPTTLNIYIRDWGVGDYVITPTALSANTWTRVNCLYTPVGSQGVSILARGIAVNDFPAGTTMDARDVMITEGPILFPYADGDTPGWKWLGTPGLSASAGPALLTP